MFRKKDQSKASISSIPDEVLLHTFSFLNPKALGQARAVNKQFRAIADDRSLKGKRPKIWAPTIVGIVGESGLPVLKATLYGMSNEKRRIGQLLGASYNTIGLDFRLVYTPACTYDNALYDLAGANRIEAISDSTIKDSDITIICTDHDADVRARAKHLQEIATKDIEIVVLDNDSLSGDTRSAFITIDIKKEDTASTFLARVVNKIEAGYLSLEKEKEKAEASHAKNPKTKRCVIS